MCRSAPRCSADVSLSVTLIVMPVTQRVFYYTLSEEDSLQSFYCGQRYIRSAKILKTKAGKDREDGKKKTDGEGRLKR